MPRPQYLKGTKWENAAARTIMYELRKSPYTVSSSQRINGKLIHALLNTQSGNCAITGTTLTTDTVGGDRWISDRSTLGAWADMLSAEYEANIPTVVPLSKMCTVLTYDNMALAGRYWAGVYMNSTVPTLQEFKDQLKTYGAMCGVYAPDYTTLLENLC